MLGLIAFRLLAFVPTLIAASMVLFVAINVVPGSAAKAALGIDATPQAIARFEHQHGLNRPLHVQDHDENLRGLAAAGRGGALSASG